MAYIVMDYVVMVRGCAQGCKPCMLQLAAGVQHAPRVCLRHECARLRHWDMSIGMLRPAPTCSVPITFCCWSRQANIQTSFFLLIVLYDYQYDYEYDRL